MKKKLASKSAFFNPRVLMSCALCATGVVLALAYAFSATTKGSSGPITASASALNAVWTTPGAESLVAPVEESATKPVEENPDVLTGCAWTAGAVYPIATSNHGTVTIGANIYVFGGDSSSTASAPTTAANKFDGTTWTAIAPLPAARAGAAVTTDGTFAYILGGITTGGAIQTTITRYDPGTNTYNAVPLAPMPTGAYASTAAFVAGKILRIGGNTGSVAASLATVDVYTIGSDSWAAGPAFPVAVSYPMSVTIGGFIYAGGGLNTAGTDSVLTARYDPAGAGSWSDAAIADLPPSPNPHWGAASAVLGGNNWIVGPGASGGFIVPNAMQWDPLSNLWSPLPNATARYRLSGAALGSSFYAIGGNPFGGTNNNQKLTCTGAATPTPSAAPSATATASPGCQNYGFSNSIAGIVTATTDIGNHDDDVDTQINLPFPVTLYGNSYSIARAGSNGFLSFGNFSSTTFYTGCMPNAAFSYTIFPWQVDQETTNTGLYPPGNGIYTLTTGTAPSRTFYIEWRTCQFFDGTQCLANSGANYEVVFQEGVSNFSIVYGTFGTADATVGAIGVQGVGISQFTQSQCNAGRPVSSKQIWSQCPPVTPTPTFPPTPTPTPTITPSPTVTPPPTQCTTSEQFFDINTLIPAGWSMTNHSTVPGPVAFFQGNPAVFPAHLGAPNSYIAANFAASGGSAATGETISDWLITPPVTLQNGGAFSFWTRTSTTPAFADRMQVRFSRNGTSQNVGVGPTGVGDFGTVGEGGTGQGDLLLDINPTYLLTGPGSYPNAWTNFTIVLNGTQIPTPGKGRLAFRYFVEDGGLNGDNSSYIGIDTVGYDCNGIIPTPTPQVTPTPTPTPTTTPTPGVTPTVTPCIILYSQVDSPGTNAVNSQNYEAAFNAFDDQAADDFVVPAGPTWSVTQVVVDGTYFNGAPPPGGPAASFHIYFYNNGAGIPGTLVTDQPTCFYTLVGNTFTIYLTSTVNFTPGTYWVSVQANMDFGAPTAGQWGWRNRTLTSNSPAAWQNPGGGFTPTPCPSWGNRGATCNIAPTEPDQIFQLLGSSSLCPSPTPSTFDISGTVTYCSGPTPNPVAGVTMTLNGGPGGSTVTAANGTYSFIGLPAGVNYTVTPSKAARPIGTSGINGVDVLAIQKHFLQIPPLLLLCHLLAADVTPPLGGNPNGVDTIAVSKFFLQLAGTASTGFYNFSPANRTYTALSANQTGQDFEARILGDVVGGFVVPRPIGDGGSVSAAASEDVSRELPSTVAAIALPEVAIDQAKSDFVTAVKSSAIDANHKLVGFQGDFTFDERVVSFANQPVSSAGLTENNWNVSGNVLPGKGPIRTLRVIGFSNDFTPLMGEGTLFNLNMTRVGEGAKTTPLIWAAAPDQFMFIDADLNTQNAGNAAPGSVTTRPSKR